MGLDKNRFVDADVKEDFICVICHDVLEDPVSINECEHTFCSTCIKDWLKNEKHQYCPMDRSPTALEQLRQPFRVLSNLLNELHIRCAYEPCDAMVKMGELDLHEQQCPYNPCNKEKEIDCPKNCGTRIKLNEHHDCIESMRNVIETLQKEMAKMRKELIEKENSRQILKSTISEKEELINKLKLELETKDAVIEFSDPKSYHKHQISQTLPRLKKHSGNNTPGSMMQTLMPLIDLDSDHQNQQVTPQSVIAPAPSPSTTPSSPKAQLKEAFLEPSTSRSPPPRPSSISTTPMVTNSKFYFEPNDSGSPQQQPPPPPPTSPGKVVPNGGKAGPPPPSTTTKESKVKSKVSLFNNMFSSVKNINENHDSGGAITSTNTSNINNNNNNNYNNNVDQQNCQNNNNGNQECRLDETNRRKIRENVLPYVLRRHFHSDDSKIVTLKGKAHSFTSAYEIRLLEYIAPLIGPESRVLDIGSGTGYLTCCLAQMCSFVCGVEHVKELVNKSHEIIKNHYQHLQLAIAKSDGRQGYEKMAPYDLILIEPMVRIVPDKLFGQLKPGGFIVAVINDSKSTCLVQMNSARQVKYLNKNKSWLLENNRDLLTDLQSQESSGKLMNLILPKSNR